MQKHEIFIMFLSNMKIYTIILQTKHVHRELINNKILCEKFVKFMLRQEIHLNEKRRIALKKLLLENHKFHFYPTLIFL